MFAYTFLYNKINRIGAFWSFLELFGLLYRLESATSGSSVGIKNQKKPEILAESKLAERVGGWVGGGRKEA
jgi:hypothetical protein